MATLSQVTEPDDKWERFRAKFAENKAAFAAGFKKYRAERKEVNRQWLNEQLVPKIEQELHAGVSVLLKAGISTMFSGFKTVDTTARVVQVVIDPVAAEAAE